MTSPSSSATGGPIRVLVVDDEWLVRTGLSTILGSSPDLRVVAAVDGSGAADVLAAHQVDVVLCDIRMPGVDGLTVLRQARARREPPAVAMLTTFAADDLVAEALRSGAAGYLLKDSAPDQLIDAVRTLGRGASVLSPDVTAAVIDGFLRGRPGRADLDRLATLSARERAVLEQVAIGATNADIGADLHLAVTTVKEHVSSILAKLGAANRVQAAFIAVRAGLVDDRP